MNDSREDELAERVAELEESLRDLRAKLGPPDRRRGPAGLPRPPTPREVLSFAGDYAIPTTIAVLEANIRALEMLQRVLRFGDSRRAASEGRRSMNARAARVGRDTMAALDAALSDLQAELEEGTLPESGEARTVLQDARRLNEEIADWIRGAEAEADESRERIRVEEGEEEEEESSVVTIDVDSELESIREEVNGEADGDDSDEADGNEDGDEP